MESHLTIDEVAKRTGLTAYTLRYYERIGLIAPIGRAPGGQRRYAASDMAWIEFLLRLRTTNMPIGKMQTFAKLRGAGDSTVPDLRQMLEEHLNDVLSKIEAMRLINFRIAADHATRLTALDGLRRTIYVSGFAKILAPNWRVGYLAAPPDLVERLLDTKLLSTLTTPSLLEKALALCIEQGQLRRHADRMRLRLAQARARSVQLALEAGCSFAAEPAGMFGWVETGVDTDMLAQRMLDEGYLIAPGALFHATRRPCTLMRINFCTTQDPAFWRTWKRVVQSG